MATQVRSPDYFTRGMQPTPPRAQQPVTGGPTPIGGGVQQPVTGTPTAPGGGGGGTGYGGGISQPVTGSPTAGTTGGPLPINQQVQPMTAGGGGQQAARSSFLKNTNPYNLPGDLNQGMLDSVYEDFQGAQDSANQANEQRYQDILGGYGGIEDAYSARTQQLSGLLEGFGDSQRQQLGRKFEQQGAGLTQEMINRGLYNTTALDAARRGMGHDQQYQNVMLEDALTRQKMDYLSRLTGEELAFKPERLNFMERRTDAGPDMSQLQQLALLAGQGRADIPDYLGALGGVAGVPGGGTGTGSGGGGLGAPNPQIPKSPDTVGSGGSRITLPSSPPDRTPGGTPTSGGTGAGSVGSGESSSGGASGGGGGDYSKGEYNPGLPEYGATLSSGGGGGGGTKWSGGLDMSGGSAPASSGSWGVPGMIPISGVYGDQRGYMPGTGGMTNPPDPPRPGASPEEIQRYSENMAKWHAATGGSGAAAPAGSQQVSGGSTGVRVPGVPYPVMYESLSEEQKKLATPWGA